MSSQFVEGYVLEQQSARLTKVAILFLLVTLIVVGCSEPQLDRKMGLDLALFMDGALLTNNIVDCSLIDGTQTTCHSIRIAGYPVNHDVGPFCPPTTSANSEEGGIWFDGEAVYDIDGEFILDLSSLYEDENWKLYDDEGNVRITETPEAFAAAARPDVNPEYMNYCVEGRMAWLTDGEPISSTVQIPTSPIVAGQVERARGNLGITLNGVVIAASAPVDAILGAYTIAAFDDCGGHINPFEGYHLHGARGCSEAGVTEPGETPIFAYAMDGFAIHSPLEGGSNAEGLDQCQGHTTETFGYHYHAANAEENGILRCFTGLIVGSEQGAGATPGRPPRGVGPPSGPPPGRPPR